MVELSPEDWDEIRRAAMEELWRRGEVWPLLEALLDRDQFADAQAIFADCDIQNGELPKDDYVLDISRQRGKSWLCCVLWMVLCHCLKGFVVKYCAQEQKSVRAIVQPTVDAIKATMPEEMRPAFVHDDSKWVFPNGSNCTAAGAENKHYTALRGQKSHLNIKDEAAFYPDYEAVERVLAPQTQTTKGFAIDASTPPESPGHPYTTVAKNAKRRGRYSHRTIYNHPRMTPDEVESYLRKEADKKGLTLEQFKQTTYYRREFLCEHVIEETRVIVPEWQHVDESRVVVEYARPSRYTAYSIIDPGETRSLFVGLHGLWDFVAGVLYVERETVLRYPSTSDSGEALVRAERELWADDMRDGRIDTVIRKSDVDVTLIRDLAKHPYNLQFEATEKTNADAARNATRAAIAQGQVLINPSCKVLLLTLDTGIWNKQRTSYEFHEQIGHADAWDALCYMWRNVQRNRNPMLTAPAHVHVPGQRLPRTPAQAAFRGAFTRISH